MAESMQPGPSPLPTPPPRPVLPVVVPPPPPPPARSRRVWLIALVVLVALCLVGAGTWAILERQKSSRVAVHTDSAEQKYLEARAAFGGSATRPISSDLDPRELASIESTFVRFGGAMTAKNYPLAATFIDVRRLVADLESRGALSHVARQERKNFESGLSVGLRNSMSGNFALIGYARYRLGAVKRLGARDAVVYCRHWDDDGYVTRMRWWMHKSNDGAWRFYDWEDLLTGMRATTLMSVMTAQIKGSAVPPWFSAVKQLPVAVQKATAEDYDGADKALSALNGFTLPADLEGFRLFVKALIEMGRGQWKEALATLDRYATLQPESPATDYMKAKCYYWLEDYGQAVAHADKFHANFGAEADNLLTKGASLAELGRTEEALAAYREALDDDPDSADNLTNLTATLPIGKRGEVAERFANSTMTAAMFQAARGYLNIPEDSAVIRSMIAAYRKAHPGDPEADLVEATLHENEERFADAAQVAKRALAVAKDEEMRAELRGTYARSMRKLGKAVEAYRESKDPETFTMLAELAREEGDAAGLSALVDARRRDVPKDASLHFYTGIAHLLKDEHAKADAAFAAASVAGHKDEYDEIKGLRVEAHYRMGRSVEALKTLPPPAGDTFRQLAWLHASDADADGLDRLIRAHRAAEPEDAQLPQWDAELNWLRKDYGAAADAFLALIANVKAAAANKKDEEGAQDVDEDDDDDDDDGAWRTWRFECRLIDSLLRANRGDEAFARAQSYQREYGKHYFLLWVYAARGDVARATKAFKACVEEGRDAHAMFDDENFEQYLSADKFKPLRDAYPPPASQPADPE